MNPHHRRAALQAGLGLGAALLLPGRARACEFFTRTLRIKHPWTRASAPGAQVAVVCMGFDEVLQDDRLIGVETPVAEHAELGGSAEGHGRLDLAIPAGLETLLSEQGRHVRLLGLRWPLEVAREYPLKLVFEKGGAVNASLSVDYARFR